MDNGTRYVWLDLEMTGLDDKTCSIIEMAMQKRPEDRFQTAEEFASALEFAVPPVAMGGRAPMSGTIPPPPVSTPRPPTPDAAPLASAGTPPAWAAGGTPPVAYGAPLQGGVVASAPGAWATPPLGAEALIVPAPLVSPQPPVVKLGAPKSCATESSVRQSVFKITRSRERVSSDWMTLVNR